MNIKGKHLELCRFISGNKGIKTKDAVAAGFELSMIVSLRNKGVISHPVDNLYLPTEIESRVYLKSHRYSKDLNAGVSHP